MWTQLSSSTCLVTSENLANTEKRQILNINLHVVVKSLDLGGYIFVIRTCRREYREEYTGPTIQTSTRYRDRPGLGIDLGVFVV